MRLKLAQQLLALAILLVTLHVNNASRPIERLLRRQAGENEQESTTPKGQANSQQAPQDGSQSPRLYPDLPRQPNFLPPFNAPPTNGFQPPSLVPFGMQLPPRDRLNADQQPLPYGRMPLQPRPMTAAERLQSQSFANGLGRRLLSMIGIDTSDKSNPQVAASTDPQQAAGRAIPEDSTMQALQNSTVLQQLNKGVQSIYGGLSKMYNSTIQQQLDLLQERFKSETANSTNPWHQRMAQQVPAYFKQVAGKVGEAQEQLNRVWRDLSQGNSTMLNRQDGQPRSFFGSFDHFLNEQAPGDFLNRAFSNQPNPSQATAPNQTNQTNQRDLATRLREMWHTQVEPELMNIRGQVSRVWRDMVANGAVAQEPVFRIRQNNLASSANGNASSSPDLVDSILKEVDVSNSEYSLVEPKGEADSNNNAAESAPGEQSAKQSQQEGGGGGGIKLSPQMQSRMVEMQSELNRLWMGLTNSLQSALSNVKRTVNPQPQFDLLNPMESSGRQATTEDPQQNEISDKIKDLAKVQRDADMVRSAIEQQQRETQQRQSFGDRFMGLFNNDNMRGLNQLPDRIGEQFNRFGNAVGNFWNRLPDRWDTFMTNVRQPTQMNGAAQTAASTTSTTTTSPNEK